jgi:RHS repeat-associated protein
MKQFYFFIALLTSYLSFSQNFADTKGELQISSSGTATYTLPIAVPPSIKNVAPTISLNYSSGVRGGIAGQGWSINSISAISRIATRRDIDGYVDGVDFDDNDKLALDGQRLLLKTGTYWAGGSTYETEYKSNTKIELKIEGTTTYFVVTAPDGSRSWYGSKGSGSLQNSVSLNAWYIVHYEDVNGNFIDYNYKTVSYNSTNQLYIDNISFSGNTAAGIATQNKISFNYRSSKRIERDYIKGVPVYATQILESIMVYANNTIFRTYKLVPEWDTTLGYERVKSIQEINAQNEVSNPVVFTYAPIRGGQERTEKVYTNTLAFDKTDLAGDFDGDGRLDFIADNKIFTNLFNGSTGNSPINLPFTGDKRQLFTATTLASNKLNQFQSIIYANETPTATEFKFYNLSGGAVTSLYSKTISIDNVSYRGTDTFDDYYCSYDEYNCGYEANPQACIFSSVKKSTNYLEGDFNGDGISEVLIFNRRNETLDNYQRTYHFYGGGSILGCDFYVRNPDDIDYFMLDLNPNSSNQLNSAGFVKLVNASALGTVEHYEKRIVADFNGDGKSDILKINGDKTYKIFSFKQLTTAPWIELEIIGSGTLDKYSLTKQLLFGDYNGDGKTDIMLPDSEGGAGQVQWHIYYSNPNPAGGSFFTKESHNIVEYRPDTTKDSDYKTQVHYSNYYAMDINGDGKSDLVRVWRKYFKDSWTINNHDTEWQVTGFINNIGNVGVLGFTPGYNSGVFFSNSPDIPIPIVSNFKYNGANTDLVLVRGHYNKIEYYQFNKNVDAENRLISVEESSGNIKQIIEYKAMEALDNGLGNATTDFYSSSDSVTYPNIEIIRNSNSYLVSKLTATINGVSKYQKFRYRGYVSNFNYGSVGFIKTTRSSWYLSESDTKLWTTQYNDVALKGANTITWTSTDENTVFNSTPTALVSSKINEFAVNTVGGDQPWNNYPNDITISNAVTSSQNFIANNSITASSGVSDNLGVNYQAAQIVLKDGFSVKATGGSSFRAYPLVAAGSAAPSNSSVFNVLLNKQTSIDHVTDTKIETAFTYDGTVQSSNYFGLETKSVTKTFSGATLQGTTTVDTQYDSNATGSGSNYYVGRPKKVNTSTTIYTGDTRTSEEVYTYSGSNLVKTEKKGHNTYAIVEDMSYDSLGNLVTKTVSAPGAPTPLPSRTIKDEYDDSKRFVIKKTDHQGFITNFVYNSLGQMKQSSDYMGIVSDFSYDNWGKLLNSTVTNSSTIPLSTTNVYTKLGTGGYTLTTTNNLEAKTITEYDVLGRVVKSSAKGFAANTMVSRQIVYDGLGRKEKESEPYFSAPDLWTNYEYDFLMRPTKVLAPTGKTQSISYSGLTTTSSDDGRITTATVNALGSKVQTTDPGGTINFTYFANGQLKESDYQGNKVQIDIDGWGNKVKMVDPSAGAYTYSYDAFGQLLTETTPNGTTTLVYDSAGKQKEKTIVGTNTNSKTTYVYNALNQITSSTYVDNNEAKTTTNTYEYDNLKRLFKTTEATPYAVFVKELTFDNLGRTDKETSTANAAGKSSSKTVRNTYQNGFPWQILDDATQQVLWQSNTLNERGQLLTAAFGNGITVTNAYDQYGYVTQFKHDKINPTVVNIMTLNTAFEIKRGNLNSRTNSLFGRNETFKYDGLDRLTEFTNGSGAQETQVYDDKGRITQNSVGTYEYDGAKTYQNKAINLTPEALSYYQTRSYSDGSAARSTAVQSMAAIPPPPSSTIGLEITYNTFKSPVSIKERGGDESYIDYINFTYNQDNNRSTMFYGSLEEDKLLRKYRKHYSADGTMEIKQNIETGTIEFVTYIGGDGYSAPVVVKSNGITQNYLYLHRDYQGTIVAISDQSGAIVEKRLFDAWGNIAKVQDGSGNILTALTVLDRGYTGHEHLQSVGLINMNGRLYDPKLHRFLQPDNYVQEPYNTQNYNKYAYVLNNPLKYTDPSGEFAEIGFLAAVGIGAAVAALTYTITALVADVPFTVGGLVKSTFIGAASAAVTFGIGSASTELFTNFFSRAAFQAIAHGTFQGGMTAMSGGKFWSGFAAGALSSIAASLWSGGSSMSETGTKGVAVANTGMAGIGGNFATSGVGMIAFGTVSGGAGAALTGGNFWQGAVTGLVVSGLNHALHNMKDRNDPPRTIKTKMSNKEFRDFVKNETEILDEYGGNISDAGSFAGALSIDKNTIVDLFKGKLPENILNPLSAIATIVKFAGDDLIEIANMYRKVEGNYLDLHKSNTNNMKGVLMYKTHVSIPVSGGTGIDIYKFYDVATNKYLGGSK